MKDNPVQNLGVLKALELFNYLNIFDPKYTPSNYNKADGTRLRLFDSSTLKIDVSKPSKENMGFWHRNIDYNEVIICVRGALRWETEMGVLPENVLIELKCTDKLNYVGDKK